MASTTANALSQDSDLLAGAPPARPSRSVLSCRDELVAACLRQALRSSVNLVRPGPRRRRSRPVRTSAMTYVATAATVGPLPRDLALSVAVE
jgi:hypothetical protein